jgi:hypothetical protein
MQVSSFQLPLSLNALILFFPLLIIRIGKLLSGCFKVLELFALLSQLGFQTRALLLQ